MIRDSIAEISDKFLHTLHPSVTNGSVGVTHESPVCNSSRNTRIEIIGIIVSEVVTIVGVPSYIILTSKNLSDDHFTMID